MPFTSSVVWSHTARRRAGALVAAAAAIAAGLAIRRFLPWGFWSKYLGVALWAVVVYALLVFIRPRIRLTHCAALALLISWSVELAQLTPVPGWLSAQHPLLRLVFGADFGAADLPAYAAGVLTAAMLHAFTCSGPASAQCHLPASDRT